MHRRIEVPDLEGRFQFFLDLLTFKFLLSYSTRLQSIRLIGLITATSGIISLVPVVSASFFLNVGWGTGPLLLLAVILIVIGFQFITMGLLGEIMVRTYHEAVEKHIYVIRDVLDADGEPRDLSD